MNGPSTRDRVPPWWLEPGPDPCDFCLRSYHAEVGYYCAECDRAVCPACVAVIREHETVLCPECASPSADEGTP